MQRQLSEQAAEISELRRVVGGRLPALGIADAATGSATGAAGMGGAAAAAGAVEALEPESAGLFDVQHFDCRAAMLNAHQSGITALCPWQVERDRFVLFSGSHDARIKMWRVDEGVFRLAGDIEAHRYTVWGLVRHGDAVYSASADGRILCWDVSNVHLKPRQPMTHDAKIYSLATHHDLLCSGSADKSIKVWDLRQSPASPVVATLNGHSGAVWSVKFASARNPASDLLSAGNCGNVNVWDARTWTSRHCFNFENNEALAVECTEDGAFGESGRNAIAVGCAPPTLIVFSVCRVFHVQNLRVRGSVRSRCAPTHHHSRSHPPLQSVASLRCAQLGCVAARAPRQRVPALRLLRSQNLRVVAGPAHGLPAQQDAGLAQGRTALTQDVWPRCLQRLGRQVHSNVGLMGVGRNATFFGVCEVTHPVWCRVRGEQSAALLFFFSAEGGGFVVLGATESSLAQFYTLASRFAPHGHQAHRKGAARCTWRPVSPLGWAVARLCQPWQPAAAGLGLFLRISRLSETAPRHSSRRIRPPHAARVPWVTIVRVAGAGEERGLDRWGFRCFAVLSPAPRAVFHWSATIMGPVRGCGRVAQRFFSYRRVCGGCVRPTRPIKAVCSF